MPRAPAVPLVLPPRPLLEKRGAQSDFSIFNLNNADEVIAETQVDHIQDCALRPLGSDGPIAAGWLSHPPQE